MQNTTEQKDLVKLADEILAKAGFDRNGRPIGQKSESIPARGQGHTAPAYRRRFRRP